MDNKKRLKVLYIVCTGFALISFILTGVSIFIKIDVLIISAFFAGFFALCLLIFLLIGSKDRITAFYEATERDSSENGKTAAQNIPIPAIIVAENDSIMWQNEAFSTDMARHKSFIGEKTEDIFDGKRLENLKNGEIIFFNEGNFRVFSKKIDGEKTKEQIFLFANAEDYIRISELYEDTRPCVFSVIIDNYEEVFADVKDSDRTKMIAVIEEALESFANQSEGLFKRLSRDRYIIIASEAALSRHRDEKFPILDEIRKLSAEYSPASISIGVGLGSDDFSEIDYYSRQAVEMAQGRGGDQAVIKNGENYEFYGGVSQGVEKRTRVKTRIIASALGELIESADHCLIMGHAFGDLDSIGSAVGLAGAIRRLGKDAHVVVKRKQNLVEPLIVKLEDGGYTDLFIEPEEALGKQKGSTVLFILDTHVSTMLESPELYEKYKDRLVVIDHHRRMVGYIEDALIFFHEPSSSSTCEMVTELIQYLNEDGSPTPLESEALLSGIMLDTKNFVLRTGVRTFEAAAYLKRKGANTIEVKKLFSSDVSAHHQKAEIVSAAQIYKGCAISVAENPGDDMRIVAPQSADELLTITGVKASFVIYPLDKKRKRVQISARSLGEINVQTVLERIGGGGHLTMAGATLEDGTAAALDSVKKSIDEHFSVVKQ